MSLFGIDIQFSTALFLIEMLISCLVLFFAIIAIIMVKNFWAPLRTSLMGKQIEPIDLASYGRYWGRFAVPLRPGRSGFRTFLSAMERGLFFRGLLGEQVFIPYSHIAMVHTSRDFPLPHSTIIIECTSGKRYWFCFPLEVFSQDKGRFRRFLQMMNDRKVPIDPAILKRPDALATRA